MIINQINCIPALQSNNISSKKQEEVLPIKTNEYEKIAFKGFFSNVFSPIQNSISENKAYNEIYNAVTGKDRKNLEIL